MHHQVFGVDDKAYKKAYKQYRKCRGLAPEKDHEWTPFRVAEKRYMAKFPPLNLSNVLDVVLLEKKSLDDGEPRGSPSVVRVHKIDLFSGDGRQRKAYSVLDIPGLVIIPDYLTHNEQKSLVRWSLEEQARYPNDTNLDIHYVLPEEGLWNYHIKARTDENAGRPASNKYIIQPKRPTGSEITDWPLVGPRPLIENESAEILNFESMKSQPKPPLPPSSHLPPTDISKLLPKLRWANIGYSYHWGSKTYDFSRPKAEYPENVRTICKDIVAAVDWQQVWGGAVDQDWGGKGPDWDTWHDTYDPDAGIVNFYQLKDKLCGHVDRSEVCSTSPLVSISLGNAAIFLMGGLTRSVEPVPILLRSGDIVIMSGPGCRRAYHGVPRILESTSPSHLLSSGEDEDWQPFTEYLRTTRININVRQVFPRGFDPFVCGTQDESGVPT